MRKREAGIDLVRCVGLLFVVSVHFFLYNGFYSEPQVGGRMLVADSFRWLFFSCNGIYMTMSGYLKSTEPLSRRYYHSLAPVLLGYVLISAVSIPVRQFVFGDQQTWDVWITKFFDFGGCYYGWYVKMYIGLLLISPIINLALQQLQTPKQLLWLAGTMLVVTALPSATDLVFFPDYWTALYPLTFYVLGAVIRRLQPEIRPWQGLGIAALTAFGLGLATLLSTDGKSSDGYGQGYGGFWITLIVLGIFLGLYRVQPGRRLSKILAWASGGCFEGYLLSHLLDGWVYLAVPAWRTPEKYLTAYVCLTIPIYIASIFMGKLFHRAVIALLRQGRGAPKALQKQ